MQPVTVFGNPLEPQDSLAVRLVPALKKKLPEIEFMIQDPTESLEPAGDPWVILDVAQGIETVTVIEDLKDLERIKGSSVHDYDVYLDLRLREKLGELPRLRLILIPVDWKTETALDQVAQQLERIISARR